MTLNRSLAVAAIVLMYSCKPVPPVPPIPPPTPEPTPTPTPFVCVIPDSEDPLWGSQVSPGDRPTVMYAYYRKAVESVGDRCGQASSSEVEQIQTLVDIANALKADGVCAARWSDSVAILAPDGMYEEWHAVYFGNGCTITGKNAYKGAWPYND